MKLATVLLASAFVVFLTGCATSTGATSSAPPSAVSATATAASVTSTATPATDTTAPPFTQAETRLMTALVKSYMHAVASGSRTAATSAFVSTDSEAVGRRVAQDIAGAKANPKVAVEKTIRLSWIVANGDIMPPARAGEVSEEQRTRLTDLTRQYGSAALATFEPIGGASSSFFVVLSDGAARLAP